MYLTQKSHHKTCYTTYGETAEQGSLLTPGSLQDTEEKGSISNTEQKKKGVPVLAAMPVSVGRPLEHSTAQERLPTIKPASFKFSVQGREDIHFSSGHYYPSCWCFHSQV